MPSSSHPTLFFLSLQAFLKGSKYDAWLDVSADADPKRLLQKAQLVANSGTCALPELNRREHAPFHPPALLPITTTPILTYL